MDPRTEKMLAERAEKIAATPAPPRGPVQAARRWAETHANAAKLLACAVVVVLLAARYLLVTLPAQRADQNQLAVRAAQNVTTETASRSVAVSDCLSKAQTDADGRWTAACKARREGANCSLPQRQAEEFERAESAARNACLFDR